MHTRLQGNLLSQLSQDNARAASVDWRFYWYMVKRRHWLLVIPTILLSLAAFYIKLATDPVYESSTAILVSGSKLMTRSIRRIVPGVTATDEMSGVTNYVQSTRCIQGLINTLNLKMPPAITARAAGLSRALPEMSQQEIARMLFVDKVRGEITVVTKGLDLIKISARHGNPQRAYMITKTLARVFMDEFQRRQVGGIRGVREFSEEQVAIYRQKLQESEKRLRQFQEGVIRNRMKDTDIGRATSDRIKTDIANLSLSVRDKEARLQLLAENLQSTMNKPQKIRTAEIEKSRAKLFGKVDELIDFLSRFTWTDSPILRLNDTINAIRRDIYDDIKAYVKSRYGEKDEASRNLLVEWNLALLDIEVLKREKSGLQIRDDSLEKSLIQGPAYQMTLRNLQQDVEQNRDMHLQFLQQTRGTQIEEQIQRRDAEFKLQIVTVAQKPLYPINAGMKFKLILICLPFLGLAIGGGIVFGLDYIDHSVRDVHEVEKEFNVPVWGVIPEIGGGTGDFWSRFGWIIISLLMMGVGATVIYLVEKGGARMLF